MSEFADYLDQVKDEVQHVQGLLSKPMSDNGNVLVEELREIESYNARMLTLLSFANGFLDGAESEAFRDLDCPTVKEKEYHLKAMVLHERRFRDVMEGLVTAIAGRLSLGKKFIDKMGKER